jgi:hypothetical protein
MQNENTKTLREQSIKASFDKAVSKIKDYLNKCWIDETKKKFIIHLINSFYPYNSSKVKVIDNFTAHDKYNGKPKVCALTGFLLTDINFAVDQETIEHFEKKKMKITELVLPVKAMGSSFSDKMLSAEALTAFGEWITIMNVKDSEIEFIVKNAIKGRTKKPTDGINVRTTYSLGDNASLQALKNKLNQ